MPTVARSLAEAFRLRATATHLLLRASPDLACVNLMCEQVGRGCACRLALALERMPLLEEVDVGGNALPQLPDALLALPRLRVLRAAGNALQALPRSLAACAALEALDVGGSACAWRATRSHPPPTPRCAPRRASQPRSSKSGLTRRRRCGRAEGVGLSGLMLFLY